MRPRLLAGETTLRFVHGERGSKTLASGSAVVIARLALESTLGIFHLTKSGSVAWFDFIQEAAHPTNLTWPSHTER